MQKFRRDNEISFILWVMQFEAQLNVMGITDENGKWKILLCCANHCIVIVFEVILVLLFCS